MMKRYRYSDLSAEEINRLCRRPKMDFATVFEAVEPIIDEVRRRGDSAVATYTEKYDGFLPDPLVIDPATFNIELARKRREAIDRAFENIHRFHKAQLDSTLEVETMAGVRCMRVTRAIDRVGLYVPGGNAILPSTLMMLGIPAMLAGVEQLVVATPPGPDGAVAPEILYIAQKLNIRSLVKAGGAQAVAAMAWGTETVPKVDKIVGPGNQYVTAAKMWLQNSEAMISIDMPAGPSEVLVIADHTANPAFVASDLLSQAEHGSDSQVVLVATTDADLDAIDRQLSHQLEDLPRKEMAEGALENSFAVIVDSIEEAFDFSNSYAPEHLVIPCEDADRWVQQIKHAGSVFLGPWSPESAGDYASGTNHTLPTYGYARIYSGVSTDTFTKQITLQQLDQTGIKALGPVIAELADIEQLEGHRRSVTLRLEKLNNQ
ncbi:MAG: histidinol dehydrogenase [Balneolaceae bacterium]|nr:histidinol dehydrogenase [Balneolaceae bacterium]